MQRYDDPVDPIHVRREEVFAIALRSNPTTGYTWHASIDPRHVDMISRKFERTSEAIGAGGQEVFTFRPRDVIETAISFEYRRPWEKEPGEQKRVQVVVT